MSFKTNKFFLRVNVILYNKLGQLYLRRRFFKTKTRNFFRSI